MTKNFKLIKIMLLSLVLLISLNSCNKHSDKGVELSGEVDHHKDIFEMMRDDLRKYPHDFYSTDEVATNCFIHTHTNIYDNTTILENFYEDYNNGIESSFVAIMYTDEGDPIIRKYYFEGSKIFVVSDSTRDDFGTPKYYQKVYNYLKLEENQIEKNYYLINDNSINFKDAFESWNDYPNEGIDYYYVAKISLGE